MNNLKYLRDACFCLMDANMHHGLRQLVSIWLHLPPTTCSSTGNIALMHKVKTTDPIISSIFRGSIVYYSTAFIGRIRFTTTEYARDKVTDDSSIVFKSGSEEHFGRIRQIFTVNDGQPIFYIDGLTEITEFQCATSTDTYRYPDIQTGVFDPGTAAVFVDANDVIEKCVCYERGSNTMTFYRFPNLQESSWRINHANIFTWTKEKYSWAVLLSYSSAWRARVKSWKRSVGLTTRTFSLERKKSILELSFSRIPLHEELE